MFSVAQPLAASPEPLSPAGGGGVWLQDNTIVFSTGSDTNGLFQVPAKGGIPHVLVPTDPLSEIDFHEPMPLPDGKSVLFIVHHSTNGIPGLINSIAVS